jgi:hypothetical protein
VLRRARPAVEDVAKALNTDPAGDGCLNGYAPTAVAVPTSTRATKNALYRQRTANALPMAQSGTRKPMPISQRSWV